MNRRIAQHSTFSPGTRAARFVSVLGLTTLALGGVVSAAQNVIPAAVDAARVDRLLGQMTLEEKMALIRGASEDPATNQGEAGYLAGVARLGIPPIRLADGPPGVLTRLPSQAETATMGLAATFSLEDARANGVVIAHEAKSLGIDVVLEPFINIDRDITSVRAYNTYGEDPMLTGAIGAALIRGTQGEGVMAMAKHFVAYDGAGMDSRVDDQTLHEIYVAPFIDAVNAGVSSIMCSYNKVNGTQACGNPDTLVRILKQEAGFKGFVTSDWGAVHAATYISNGLDMEMPGVSKNSLFGAMQTSYFDTQPPSPPSSAPPKFNAAMGENLLGGTMPEEPAQRLGNFAAIMPAKQAPPVTFWNLEQSHSLDTAAITAAARRVLLQLDRFGYLDHPPSHRIQPHMTAANAAIIRKTGEDAAVLLKNSDQILPLKADDLSSLAMVGPGAGQVVAVGTAGERSVGFPWRQVGPYEALQKLAPGAHVTLAVADDMTGTAIPAAVLSHDGQPGLLCSGSGCPAAVDGQVDHTRKSGSPLARGAQADWSGTLTVPADGSYWIYVQLLGAAGNLAIDGKPVAMVSGLPGGLHGDTVLAGKHGLMPTTDGLDNYRTAVSLAAGPHTLALTVGGDTSGNPEQVRLAWVTPAQREATRATAVAAAKAAKVAVVFVWSRGKPVFALPGDQDQLVNDIAAVNPNTIVVLNVSQPVALPWLDKVKAVVQMWYPGDEGGWATADVLLGRTNPAGRLPFTWAKQLTDYPATDPAHPERLAVDGVTTFSEGIDVGYRWFDKQGIEPLFPFGFGLSYSAFKYTNLHTQLTKDDGLAVTFTLTNTGSRAGDEVPQVYLGPPVHRPAQADFAKDALAGFARVRLSAGQSKLVTIRLAPRALQYWSIAGREWKRAAGPRELKVGASSRDFRLDRTVSIP